MLPPPFRKIRARSPARLSSRQRVMAQWRGIDIGPAEEIRRSRFTTPADVMPPLLKELRMEFRRAEAEVIKVWNHLLDTNVVAHAQPTGLRNGTLFVTVDSSVWLDEIVRYRRREILDRLQYSFSRDFIKKISFRVG